MSISVLHLFWVVPVAAALGFLLASLLAGAACSDCLDAHRLQLDISKAREFEAGFAHGLAQMEKVG